MSQLAISTVLPTTMASHNTCALLIGSGKYEQRDACHAQGKKTAVKKGGIREKLSKDGRPIPDGQWAHGDIENMVRLLTSKGGIDFSRFDYLEQDQGTCEYAKGKFDVLEEIGRFFEKADKTHFILYYTGHADENGSWCFPVTRRLPKTGTGSRHSSHSEQLAEQGSGVETQGAGTTTVEVEVHVPPSAAEGHAQHIETESNLTERGAEGSGIVQLPVAENTREQEASVVHAKQESTSDTVSSLEFLEPPPEPAKKWNDYVTFEKVIQLWDEKKKGERNRYLMMILDCCHAGRWVEMVDALTTGKTGEGAIDQTNENVAENGDGEKRRDICIQAACRALENCTVARNQESSVFTRAFVAAQNTSFSEKVALSVIDHVFVLNIVSILRSRQVPRAYSPVSSQFAPFGGIKFFDSFDDMYL